MTQKKTPTVEPEKPQKPATDGKKPSGKPVEIGGREGPDPTRYGDWEKDGRCIDF